MIRAQHGILEWLKNISEYDSRVYGPVMDSIARAARSGSNLVVLYGREFDSGSELWDDAIRFIEASIIAERSRDSKEAI